MAEVRCHIQLVGFAACLLLGGCKSFDADLLERSEVGVEGEPAARDGGASDAGGACGARVERCNSIDDDCDGKLDEGAASDCSLDHGAGACVAGRCVLALCEPGYADCNRMTEDGCEQANDAIACGECGRVCAPGETGRPRDAGAGPGVNVGAGDDEDAGTDEGGCTPSPEQCNGMDDDCDANADEGGVCTVAMCAATTPTYRGAACDSCACASCTTLIDQCQNHPDATWRAKCRALVECYVEHDRLGECGDNADCYMSGNGPCAAEINIASGGANAGDTSRLAAGCAAGTPPAAPCAAAVNYRDQCSLGVCAAACGP